MSPEKTPFFTFSKARVTTSLLLTAFAISILSSKFTPAELRLPIIKDILAIKDFKIISPNTGIFKTRWCHLYRTEGIFVVVYLNIANNKIHTIPNVKPPVPLIKLLAVIITAVGVGRATPIPSYISAKTGTTLINMKTITVIATVNITTG